MLVTRPHCAPSEAAWPMLPRPESTVLTADSVAREMVAGAPTMRTPKSVDGTAVVIVAPIANAAPSTKAAPPIMRLSDSFVS